MLSRMFVNSFCGYHFADTVLDDVAEFGRLFNARTCPGTDVKSELPAVNRRKEVLTKP